MKSILQNPLDDRLLKRRVLEAYQELDHEISEKMRKGKTVPICKKGCSSCCSDYFYVSKGEYLVILDYVRQQGQPINENEELARKTITQIQVKYPEEYERLKRVNHSLGDWDDSHIPDGGYPCVFLREGLCSIYPVRPIICRLYGISRSYPLCNKILNKCKKLFSRKLDEASICAHTVDVPYDDRYVRGIDYIETGGTSLLLRPYPIFWWFAKETTGDAQFSSELTNLT